jgi:hypothetical protein
MSLTRKGNPQAQVDRLGKYCLDGIPLEGALVAYGETWAPAGLETVHLDSKSVPTVDLHVTHAASITGAVVDAQGHPVPKASLFVTRGFDQRSTAAISSLLPGTELPGLGHQYTDGQGHFHLIGLAPGMVEVTVRAEGLPQQLFSLRAPNFAATMRLSPVAELSGVVVDGQGRPLAHVGLTAAPGTPGPALLSLVNVHGSSDDQGHFVLKPLPPGPCTVSARDEKLRSVWTSAVAPSTEVRVAFPAFASISGRVTNRSSTPNHALAAWAWPDHSPDAGVARWDSGMQKGTVQDDGSFTIDGLSPGASRCRWRALSMGQP